MARPLIAICLIVLLIIAGCVGTPFGDSTEQDQPATLILNNSANATQTFRVAVVDPDKNMTVYRNDSKVTNFTVSPGVGSYNTDKWYYTKFEFPESARLQGRYTLEPEKETRSKIGNLTGDTAVVVVLSQNNKIGWYGTANCGDGALVYMAVRSSPGKTGGDASVSYRCDNSPF